MPPVKSELEIVPVRSRSELKEFISLQYRLYRDDPHWSPPLWVERYETLHPKKNPFYGHAEVQLFLARRQGSTVGRISGQIDHEYEKFHKERVGHFGFFECENDPITAQTLLRAAEDFHRSHGASRSLGPFSFSINEESGLLIEGFQEPLMTMMPYNPPFYSSLLEGAGYRKAKDLYAWKYLVGEIPKDPAEVAESVSQYPGLKVRTLHPKNLRDNIGKVMEIFNSAWSENWGFVPLTQAEIDKVGKDLQ